MQTICIAIASNESNRTSSVIAVQPNIRLQEEGARGFNDHSIPVAYGKSPSEHCEHRCFEHWERYHCGLSL